MKLCKKIMLRRYVRKYERFLLEEGIKESARRGKNIQFGLEDRAIISEDPYERVYLPQNEQGQTDISPILALGAENHPEEARKYLGYRKMLERLER